MGKYHFKNFLKGLELDSFDIFYGEKLCYILKFSKSWRYWESLNMTLFVEWVMTWPQL